MTERKFKARRGQIDYTSIHWVPVVNAVVCYKDTILLVKRSKGMRLYPGYWSGISGFLDDKKSPQAKIAEELREEIGLPKRAIASITEGTIFHQIDKKHKKTWIVHPLLVTVTSDKVKLNWEAEDYKWVLLRDVKKLKTIPDLGLVFKNLSLR